MHPGVSVIRAGSVVSTDHNRSNYLSKCWVDNIHNLLGAGARESGSDLGVGGDGVGIGSHVAA